MKARQRHCRRRRWRRVFIGSDLRDFLFGFGMCGIAAHHGRAFGRIPLGLHARRTFPVADRCAGKERGSPKHRGHAEARLPELGNDLECGLRNSGGNRRREDR